MSDPKIPDDAHPSGDPPSDAPPRPGRTAPYARPAPGAFVVPFETLGEDVPSVGASVIVRESYANEVPPVVARPLKQPGEDEPTTRVEVVDEAALAAEMAEAAGAAPGPAADDAPPDGPTRRIAVVTDDDLEDEEARTGAAPGLPGQPAVIVDGPSEAYAAPGADRCPYCLTFVGLSSARTRGVRYCPMCGADWTSLDRKIEAPSGAVIPLGDDVLLPMEDPLEDHPTNQFTRLGPTRPKPGEPGFVAPPPTPTPAPREPGRRTASPWLMLLTGVSLGLAGTMTVAWLYNRRQPPSPTVVAAAPPSPRVSPPVVQTPIEPDPSEPVKPAPVEPAPTPPAPTPPAPVKPAPTPPEPVEPAAPEPPEPAVVVSEDSVQAAIIDTTSLLPPRARVDIRPRVEGDIVFLTGVVDGTETLGQVITAVAAVEGVRAVDSRGVRPAWKYYTVVKGDSLSKIAQLYYGDTNAWPRVFQANRDVVKTPSALIPGMKLRIPMSPI